MVCVDGVRVVFDDLLVYLVLNKLCGMYLIMFDDCGCLCIGDLIE